MTKISDYRFIHNYKRISSETEIFSLWLDGIFNEDTYVLPNDDSKACGRIQYFDNLAELLTAGAEELKKEREEEKKQARLKECPGCLQKISKRAKNCPKCSLILRANCAVCQNEISISKDYCPNCGDPEPFEKTEITKQKNNIICTRCGNENISSVTICQTCSATLPDKPKNIPPSRLLVNCPSCKKNISKRAPKCPYCHILTSQPCHICENIISVWDQECPECGDPEPLLLKEFKSKPSLSGESTPVTTPEHSNTLQEVNTPKPKLDVDANKINIVDNKITLDKTCSKKGNSKVTFSWKVFLVSFLIATILNIALSIMTGTEPRKNIVWTVLWIYLTIIAWRHWNWKALLPYPLYLLISFMFRLAFPKLGMEPLNYIYLTGFLNIGGLILFCLALYDPFSKK